jgi:hypothetical protein
MRSKDEMIAKMVSLGEHTPTATMYFTIISDSTPMSLRVFLTEDLNVVQLMAGYPEDYSGEIRAVFNDYVGRWWRDQRQSKFALSDLLEYLKELNSYLLPGEVRYSGCYYEAF